MYVYLYCVKLFDVIYSGSMPWNITLFIHASDTNKNCHIQSNNVLDTQNKFVNKMNDSVLREHKIVMSM